jgi:hypothetical protein
MTATYPLAPAIEKGIVILALFSTMFLAYPETTVLAQGLQVQNGNTAQVFDINSKSKDNLIASITMADIVTPNDYMAHYLYNYLAAQGSPLKDYAAEIVSPNPDGTFKYSQWKRALAISFMESHMCKRTPKLRTRLGIQESYNCSGIANGKRVYHTYLEWFSDMNDLMNKPAYVNRPTEKFRGFYVVPGSSTWVNVVKQKESELAAIEQKSYQEHLALTNNVGTATAGTPELAKK